MNEQIHSSGTERWARVDFGNADGRSFVSNAGGDFVNTPTAGAKWTVRGGGNGFDGQTADAAHFLYRGLTGDGSLTAKFEMFETGAAANAQTVLMFRTSLAPGARFLAVGVANNGGVFVAERRKDNGFARVRLISTKVAPIWFPLTRSGIVVSVSTSVDGANFTALGTFRPAISAPFPRQSFVGLATSSGNAGGAIYSSISTTGNH